MKKTITTYMLAAVALFASCDRTAVDPSEGLAEQTAELNLVFPGVSSLTKVAIAADESTAESSIKSIQIMVFNESGLEMSQTISGTSTSIKVTKGSKKIVAVANYDGDLSKSSSAESIYATATTLSDNSIGTSTLFLMSGEADVDVEGATQVSITLERIAAKFLIRKMSVKLNSAFSDSDITIDRIYVDNAVVNATLGGGKTPLAADDFVNQRGGFDNNAKYQAWVAGKYDDWTMYKPLGVPSSGTKLYTYPNETSNTDDNRDKTGSFTVRKTRIVVEATLKGKKTFYPFTFDGAIERNHYYEITELVITGYGVEHPEDPTPGKGDLTVNVIVKPWEQGGSTNIEI